MVVVISMVRFEFLGTGNAFLPQGRYHSLLLIEDKILIDAPPTVLASLRRRELTPSDIKTIMITHWHGDHVFGFPFLILDQKYISDRESKLFLNVHCPKNGTEKLNNLCELAYPGSLIERMEKNVIIDEESSGEILGVSGWSFERFEVLHDEVVDPHGYVLTHESGFTLMHTGDSGPCEAIESRVKNCDVVVIELGVPDHVVTPNHFRPETLTELANKFPKIIFLATHHYADDINSGKKPYLSNDLPNLPNNILQVCDEQKFEWVDGKFRIL
jgi:ribonuclease BN (tRNA processing enzyme)